MNKTSDRAGTEALRSEDTLPDFFYCLTNKSFALEEKDLNMLPQSL